MILLVDIGNTHTHLGLGTERGLGRIRHFPTEAWGTGEARRVLGAFVGKRAIEGVAVASVVPRVTSRALARTGALSETPPLRLTHRTVRGIEIDYPRPQTIGADRLANAVAARHRFGAPVVVVDFGTAVTFDVVNAAGCYQGGIIAPGLSAMTDYLHERTALLPRIRIRDVRSAIGRTTREAMLIGAVHGYRGLIKELISELQGALRVPRFPVVATGGYARLIASRIPAIDAVVPGLTLEGLLRFWQLHQADPAVERT